MALEEALATKAFRTAWIRCTWADRDAGRLLRRVVEALREATPGAVDVLAERLAAAQEQVNVQAATAELVEELERLLIDRVVLVFDDAEHLHDAPDAAAVMGALLSARSDALRTAVATRRPLPLKLAKLRAAGRVAEFGPAELAFGLDECAALLRLRGGRPPAEEEAERLFAATEGWPLGASLSAFHGEALSLEGPPSRARLFEFLHEEVLDHLPPELRELVLNSSVPHELDEGCMRALGLPKDLPDRAAQAGLLLRPVSSRRTWFAYHPLVREFLLERLKAQRTPEALREVHARIAPALASAGRPDEAIEHWLAGEAWPEAAEAIASRGPALLHTTPVTVWRWVKALPADLRASHRCRLLEGTLEWEAGRMIEAADCLRSAMAGFSRVGDVVGEWLARFALVDPLIMMSNWDEAVQLADGFDEEPALASGVLAPAVAAYAAAVLGGVGRVRECDELSRRLLAHPNLGPLRPARTIWEHSKMLLSGDFDDLIRGAEEAASEFESFDPVNRLPVIARTIAFALEDQGRDAEALQQWERVEEAARRVHTDFIVKTSFAFRALLYARGGQLARAEEYLARADASPQGGWPSYAGDAARARVAALRGDSGGAAPAAERAIAAASRAALIDLLQAVVELAPVFFEAGQPARARGLVDETLAVCESRVPGEEGSYSRSLLLGVRAWIRDAEGDDIAAMDDVARMWQTAGSNAADVVRREWPLLEGLLWKAMEAGALDPDSVIAAVESAWPGGGTLMPFIEHPESRVRRAALARASASGHPDLVRKLGGLLRDPDPEVSKSARAATRRLRAVPPPLEFTLFGGFRLRRGSWQVEDAAWDRRVAQRLVRYLLVKRGSAIPEDQLLEAFWPDKPAPSARRSLQVAVSCARAVVDVPGASSLIEVSEHTLGLRLRDRDSVDVDRFEEATRVALGAVDRDRPSLLEHAAALWAGEPLPEERYEDWAIPWREHLQLRYAEVLTALVIACRADGDHVAATRAAQKLVELDSLNEAAQRELMVAYARSGRRSHALRQYLECRRALIEGLGVEPTRETRDLHARVLAGEAV